MIVEKNSVTTEETKEQIPTAVSDIINRGKQKISSPPEVQEKKPEEQPEPDKEETVVENQEEQSDNEESNEPQDLDLETILGSLTDEKYKNFLKEKLDNTETSRREWQSSFTKEQTKASQLEKELEEAKKKLEVAEKQSQEIKSQQEKLNADQWFSSFENSFEEGDVDGLTAVVKDLYNRFQKISDTESIKDIERKIEEARLNTLRVIESRINEDYDEVMQDADLDSLAKWIGANDNRANQFIEIQKKHGDEHAIFVFNKKFKLMKEVENDPEAYVNKRLEEERAKNNTDTSAKKKISDINSKLSDSSSKKEPVPVTAVDALLTSIRR